MGALESIEIRKKLFHLPFKEDELEYWGPLNHAFCNSFLTMGNNFFEKHLIDLEIKTVKTVFSAFVELVQNAAEYNEENFQSNIPQTYVNVKVQDDTVFIKTANQILSKDIDKMISRLESLDTFTLDELKNEYKDALINNKSLGLIMIKRMENATFEWEIQEYEGQNWLSVELKIQYGKA